MTKNEIDTTFKKLFLEQIQNTNKLKLNKEAIKITLTLGICIFIAILKHIEREIKK